MHITSTAFQGTELIPPLHSAAGGNKNPPLTFSEVTPDAKSLVLIVDDPDAPEGTFTHWILFNMSPATLQIPEGDTPLEATQATNDFGNQRYDGPAPPEGMHRYRFCLFALDATLDLRPTDTRLELDQAMRGHVIAQAELVGRYAAETP